MIQELLYTSHDGQGLRPGSGGGFCTVLCTQGMSPNVVRKLEQLSGYKHPFDIHDERSRQNPVLYRSMATVIGGSKFAVLSRIADSRAEHSGRSNKLAHHLLVPQTDFCPAGPAAAIGSSGLMRAQWDGVVRQVEPLSASSLAVTSADGPCRCWERIAGDAGWAGAIAETLVNSKRKELVNVVIPLGTESLKLAEEVFSLFSPRDRWITTFSTFNTDSAAPCHLSFILDGTPEATIARKDHRRLVVDLCSKLPAPKSSAYVDAARSGDLSRLHVEPPARQGTARSAATLNPAGARREPSENLLELDEDEYQLAPPGLGKRLPASRPRGDIDRESDWTDSQQQRPKSRALALFLGLAGLVLLFMIIGVAILAGYLIGRPDTTASNSDSQPVRQIEPDVVPAVTGDEQAPPTDANPPPIGGTANGPDMTLEMELPGETPSKNAGDSKVADSSQSDPPGLHGPEGKTGDVDQPDASDTEAKNADSEQPVSTPPPEPRLSFEPQRPINLPSIKNWFDNDLESWQLGSFSRAQTDSLRLELHDLDVLNLGRAYSADPGREIVVRVKVGINPDPVAKFVIEGQDLVFRWLEGARNHQLDSIRWLEIRISDTESDWSTRLRLAEPPTVEPYDGDRVEAFLGQFSPDKVDVKLSMPEQPVVSIAIEGWKTVESDGIEFANSFVSEKPRKKNKPRNDDRGSRDQQPNQQARGIGRTVKEIASEALNQNVEPEATQEWLNNSVLLRYSLSNQELKTTIEITTKETTKEAQKLIRKSGDNLAQTLEQVLKQVDENMAQQIEKAFAETPVVTITWSLRLDGVDGEPTPVLIMTDGGKR